MDDKIFDTPAKSRLQCWHLTTVAVYGCGQTRSSGLCHADACSRAVAESDQDEVSSAAGAA